jgi:hypothetical protein
LTSSRKVTAPNPRHLDPHCRPAQDPHSERVIALDRTTVAALRARRSLQQAEARQAGDSYHDSGYVFTGLNGDPLAPDRLTRMFKALGADTGLRIRLHDLRHGAASLAPSASTDPKVVQDMFGHSGIVLTADTYTSVLPDIARKAAEDSARLIIEAGCLVPETHCRRRPMPWMFGRASVARGMRRVARIFTPGASLK